jgi:hypothetical protein
VDDKQCSVEIHHQFQCNNPFFGESYADAYSNADGFIVVSAVKSNNDFNSLISFIDEISNVKLKMYPIMMALAKTDLYNKDDKEAQRDVRVGLEVCCRRRLPCIDTTTLSTRPDSQRRTIENLFYYLIRYIR